MCFSQESLAWHKTLSDVMVDVRHRDVDGGWAWVALMASVVIVMLLECFIISVGIFQVREWPTDQLSDWSVDWPTVWLISRLTDWPVPSVTNQPSVRLVSIDWQTDQFFQWPTDCQTGQYTMNDWRFLQWPASHLNHQVTSQPFKSPISTPRNRRNVSPTHKLADRPTY